MIKQNGLEFLIFMKVFKVMTTDAGFCRLEDDLAMAAEIMGSKNCGIVPVIDAENRVAGVVTDRDICLAAAISPGKKTSPVKVREIASSPVIVCAGEDNVKDALRRMRKYKIRRLPVTNKEKKLLGIVSLTDILRKAGEKKSVRKLIFSVLGAIAKPPPIVLREKSEDLKL
jgi:CBS domain-containing protein